MDIQLKLKGTYPKLMEELFLLLTRSTVDSQFLLPQNRVKTKALGDFLYQSENGLRKSHSKDLPGEFDSFRA